MKDSYRIIKKSNKLIDFISDSSTKNIISTIVNKKDQGKTLTEEKLIGHGQKSKSIDVTRELDIEKLEFTVQDFSNGELISKLFKVKYYSGNGNNQVRNLDKIADGVHILNKYPDDSTCIVCDNIDRDRLH